MNVAARLCDYSKTAGEALVPSAGMLTGTAIPPGLSVGNPTNLTLRGRQTPVEASRGASQPCGLPASRAFSDARLTAGASNMRAIEGVIL